MKKMYFYESEWSIYVVKDNRPRKKTIETILSNLGAAICIFWLVFRKV